MYCTPLCNKPDKAFSSRRGGGGRQWRGGKGPGGHVTLGAQMEIRGRQNCLLVIYLARIIKIDRTLVEHFAVTCCEQSYKTYESSFVSYVFVLTMYVLTMLTCLARQLTKTLRTPKIFSFSLHSESQKT